MKILFVLLIISVIIIRVAQRMPSRKRMQDAVINLYIKIVCENEKK